MLNGKGENFLNFPGERVNIIQRERRQEKYGIQVGEIVKETTKEHKIFGNPYRRTYRESHTLSTRTSLEAHQFTKSSDLSGSSNNTIETHERK